MQTVELTLQSEIFAAGAAFIYARFLRDTTNGTAHKLRFSQDINAGDAGFAGIGSR